MTAPSRVRAVTAIIDYANGENVVTLSWLPPANPGSLPVTRYRIQYSVGGQSWGAIESIPYNYTGLPTNANSRSITHTLKTGVPFLYKPTYYRISAITGAETYAGPWVTVGPVHAITDTAAPPTVHMLTPNGNDVVTVTIAKPLFSGTSSVVSYNLKYRLASTAPSLTPSWTEINGIPYAGDYTSINVPELRIGTNYEFIVAAVNSSGVGSYSESRIVKTTNAAAIPMLVAGFPSAGSSQILGCGGSPEQGYACAFGSPRALRVFWYDNHRGPLAISSWTIQIRQNNVPPFKTFNIPNSRVKTYPTDNRLRYVDIYQGVGSVASYAIQDRVYQVQVRGLTAEGTLGFSELKAFNASWTPSAPIINNVSRVSTTAYISVTEPSHLGIIGTNRYIYDIQYKKITDSMWTTQRQVLSPIPDNAVHQLTVGNLNPSLTWQFRVSFVAHVVDNTGRAIQNGPYSNIFTS